MTSADKNGAAAPAANGVEEGLEVTRRLSDKILAAFNHAYAIGKVDIADKLRDVLKANEEGRGVADDKREGYDPLGQADLWVEFVEARNHYKWVCEHRKGEPGSEAEALESMKQAYRLWSLS